MSVLTMLPSNRPLAAVVLLTFCVSVGCTAYRRGPSGEIWEPILLSELPGSEDEFRGRRMLFHLENGGRNDVVVERIDPTFIYAWEQWNDTSKRSLTKIKLNTVTAADIHKTDYVTGIGALFLPVIIVGAVVLVIAWSLREAFKGSDLLW